MVSKFPLNELPHLFLDGISGKSGRIWRCRLSLPGQPIFRIEAKFATLRPVIAHENPGITSNISIKGVHPPGRAFLGAGFELRRGGEPTFVRQQFQAPLIGEFLEIYPEFPLGGDHSAHRAEFLN